MKQLSKEQQKQIMQNLLKQQKKQAEEIIVSHAPGYLPQEKKLATVLIMRAINITATYNVDTAPVIEDIKNLLDSGAKVSELKTYTKRLYNHADKFKQQLAYTVDQGIKRRKETKPHYPDFLRKSPTVYFSIENSLSAYQLIEQQISQINEALPTAGWLRYNPETKKLETGKQEYSVGAFFSRRKTEISKILQEKSINFQDTGLMDIIGKADYNGLIELRKNRALNKNGDNRDFIRFLSDKVLFHQLSDLIIRQHSSDMGAKIIHSLRSLQESYTRSAQIINFTQQKGGIEKDTVSIDTLIVSISPQQIATQSEYKNWRNCTSACLLYTSDAADD